MPTQTGREGISQTRHPAGPLYVTPELIPQGVRMDQSIRGAPIEPGVLSADGGRFSYKAGTTRSMPTSITMASATVVWSCTM